MEKKWLYVGGGFLAGVVVTFLVLFLISLRLTQENGQGLPGATFFNQPGQVINEKSFKVIQVIQDNAALVEGKGDARSRDMYIGAIYLMYNNVGHYYYDEEIIKVPAGKQTRQLGIYKYESRMGIGKTVPIIGFVGQ